MKIPIIGGGDKRETERAKANDPDLQELDWQWQNVGDEEVERLARALPGNTVLREIYLQDNADLTSVDALIEFLPRSNVVSFTPRCFNPAR